MTNRDQQAVRVSTNRPRLEFLLSLLGGSLIMAFSSALVAYSQYYFIATTIVQNSFLVGLVIMITGGVLYERPESNTVCGLFLIALSINEFVMLTSLLSAIPVTPISPIGPIGGVLAFFGGLRSLFSNLKT